MTTARSTGSPDPVSWPSSATRCRTVTGRPSSARKEGAVLRVGLTGGIGSGKSEVSRRLAPHGALDRERLGAIVFRDPALRAKLNAITHPLVREWMTAAERAAAERTGAD